jgi:hypothetical protein
MEPVDKFGGPIFPHVFRKLTSIGKKLRCLGYSEAISKPNLFCRSTQIVVFFADMRGTKEVPIWSDPVPLFYWKWETDNLTLPTKQNAVCIEGLRLMAEGVSFRLSNELHSGEAYEDAFLLMEKSPRHL